VGRAGDEGHYLRQLEAVCVNATVSLFIKDTRQHCTPAERTSLGDVATRRNLQEGIEFAERLVEAGRDGESYRLTEAEESRARGELLTAGFFVAWTPRHRGAVRAVSGQTGCYQGRRA
jgi:hypothetical protein